MDYASFLSNLADVQLPPDTPQSFNPASMAYSTSPNIPFSFPSFGPRWVPLVVIAYNLYKYPMIRDSLKLVITKFFKHKTYTRLFSEENGVEGCGLFFRTRHGTWGHWFGGVSQALLTTIFSPIIAVFSFPVEPISEILKAIWFYERAHPHMSVLAKSPGSGGSAQYSPTGYQPQFILKVQLKHGKVTWTQISYSTTIPPYIAISYPMDGAYALFQSAGYKPQDPVNDTGRRYSLRDRQAIAECLLKTYMMASVRVDDTLIPPTSKTEYIWIDELCLSDMRSETPGDEEVEAARQKELGRLADIFSAAAKVVVFCDDLDCNHTSPSCNWGKRLFTLGEILNASEVELMVRRSKGPQGLLCYSKPGHLFRREIQNRAEEEGLLHLHAIMKHTPNTASFNLQSSIHSLLVEAIRRDDNGNFKAHNQLGRALNGLLFRRALLEDLPGVDGWADLSWLLELNQGYYNVASLAAVCSLHGGTLNSTPIRHPWLGKPVLPEPGTERLEPLVTAIPVQRDVDGNSALNLVGPETAAIKVIPRRDSFALYRNDEMAGFRLLARSGCILLHWCNLKYVLPQWGLVAIPTFWLACTVITTARLIAQTMYLDKEKVWFYLDTKTWGVDPRRRLGEMDAHLEILLEKHVFTEWGDVNEQAVPNWHPSENSLPGSVVDLRNAVFTRVHTLTEPNAMVPLAIHGSGITCMLLDRKEDTALVSERVGMVNLPTYVSAQTKRTASVVVG